MRSNYKNNYNVDMVFCIDATGSMDNIIKIFRNNALNLCQDVKECIERKGRVDVFRVRVIAFRDYLADGENAMLVTNFFRLPQEADNLKECMSSLIAKGGGDNPEDGLEALAYAIRSEWNTDGAKKRHVIVLWTDDDTHELGYGKSSIYYPKGMAANFQELTAWWGDWDEPGYMDERAKRLVLLAPDLPGWKQISDNWGNVLHYPSDAGNGFKDVEYSQIISAISQAF